jgi:hypothetical protein
LTKRGRHARYSRDEFLRGDAILRNLLGRETRISARSFISQHLPILDFPRDVCEALERDAPASESEKCQHRPSECFNCHQVFFTTTPYASVKIVDFLVFHLY